MQSGEFELYKSLPMKKRSLSIQRSDQDISVQNVLAEKLNEVKDFPLTLKVNIFQKGSLVGEDDIIGKKEYTCTLKCISQEGSLLQIAKDEFLKLRANDENWQEVMKRIAARDAKKEALHLEKVEKPKDEKLDERADDALLTSLLPT